MRPRMGATRGRTRPAAARPKNVCRGARAASLEFVLDPAGSPDLSAEQGGAGRGPRQRPSTVPATPRPLADPTIRPAAQLRRPQPDTLARPSGRIPATPARLRRQRLGPRCTASIATAGASTARSRCDPEPPPGITAPAAPSRDGRPVNEQLEAERLRPRRKHRRRRARPRRSRTRDGGGSCTRAGPTPSVRAQSIAAPTRRPDDGPQPEPSCRFTRHRPGKPRRGRRR